MPYHLIFTDIYRNTVIFYLGVIGVHLVNSGSEMLLLLLIALTNNSAPFSPMMASDVRHPPSKIPTFLYNIPPTKNVKALTFGRHWSIFIEYNGLNRQSLVQIQ